MTQFRHPSASGARISPQYMKRFGRGLRSGLVCLVLSVVLPCLSFAMEIRRVQTCSGVVLRLRGDVREGDYSRVKSHFKGRELIIGLDLSSYGGDFEEGIRIANLARREKLAVFVSDECDSACVDIFFAATKRYVGSNTKIGVHAVSNDREVEDDGSRLLTMELARLWAKRGIPGSAIAKMITTRPDAIAYLDQADLSALDAATGNPFVYRSDEAKPERRQGCALQVSDHRRVFAAETGKSAARW
jgi:hypothetical protein